MSKVWKPSIGLEIHVELATESKLFCSCANRFSAPPNTLCCPVCLGLPGALPVLNQQAVSYALRLALALSCKINTCSGFERKHYIYPDLPKGYQITQRQNPIAIDGDFSFLLHDRIHTLAIERIQLEEDAGKTTSDEAKETMLCYNRSGVPLLEIVCKPQLHSANEAKACLQSLACLLRHLDISNVKIQEGNLRTDVNVSLHHEEDCLGQRCEMKNISGFSAVYRAIEHEIARQTAMLQQSITPKQETRRWNDKDGTSMVMRQKQGQASYRFIQEPDLGPLIISQQTIADQKKYLPELPLEKWHRYQTTWTLSKEQALFLCEEKDRAEFFEKAIQGHNAKRLAVWMMGPLQNHMQEKKLCYQELPFNARQFSKLVEMEESGMLFMPAAKEVLLKMFESGKSPDVLAQELDLLQTPDEAILCNYVQEVLQENSDAVQDFGKGKQKSIEFLLGKAIKKSSNKASPQLLRQILLRELTMKTGGFACE